MPGRSFGIEAEECFVLYVELSVVACPGAATQRASRVTASSTRTWAVSTVRPWARAVVVA